MACCASCAVGLPCESGCPDHHHHDSAGAVPMSPDGLIQLIGGVPAVVGVPQKNPGLPSLIPDGAVITPAQVPQYLLAAVPLTGLPVSIPPAASQVAMSIPGEMYSKGEAYVMATLAAWKASPQGKSAGWQDPASDAYMAWLKKAYGTDDPVGVALVDWLDKIGKAAGNPGWLQQQVASVKAKAAPSKASAKGRYDRVKVGRPIDVQKEGYLL